MRKRKNIAARLAVIAILVVLGSTATAPVKAAQESENYHPFFDKLVEDTAAWRKKFPDYERRLYDNVRTLNRRVIVTQNLVIGLSLVSLAGWGVTLMMLRRLLRRRDSQPMEAPLVTPLSSSAPPRDTEVLAPAMVAATAVAPTKDAVSISVKPSVPNDLLARGWAMLARKRADVDGLPAATEGEGTVKGLWRLGTRALLLVLPIAAWPAIELFVLPPGVFTFRPWEEMLHTYQSMPYGDPSGMIPAPAFLVNTHVKMHERGVLNPGANVKLTEWFTDAWGYRNRPRTDTPTPWDIVFIGDSHMAGDYLDQKDTLPETVEAMSGLTSYNHGMQGVRDMVRFLWDKRFLENPPRWVVYETNEHLLFEACTTGKELLRLPNDLGTRDFRVPDEEIFRSNLTARWKKHMLLNWVLARLQTSAAIHPHSPSGQNYEKIVDELWTQCRHNISKTAASINEYRKAVEARNSKFIFLMVSRGGHPGMVEMIRDAVQPYGMRFVTLPNRNNNMMQFFHTEDTHWNERGVKATAKLLLSVIEAEDARDAVGH